MLHIEKIHHIAILTSIELYEASKQFYIHILGFSIVSEVYRADRNSYKLDLAIKGLYQIELFSFPDYTERPTFPEAKGLRHLAFAVKDVAAGFEWLQLKAVKTELVRIDEFSGKPFLFFYDPSGQPLELYQL